MRAYNLLLLPVLTLLSAPVLASTVLGNPTFTIEHIAGDNTYVDQVVADYCTGGSQALPIQATLAKGNTTNATLSADTFCSLEVDVKWAPTDPITTVTVTGLDELKIVAASGAWTIELDADNGTATFVTD